MYCPIEQVFNKIAFPVHWLITDFMGELLEEGHIEGEQNFNNANKMYSVIKLTRM